MDELAHFASEKQHVDLESTTAYNLILLTGRAWDTLQAALAVLIIYQAVV